MKKKLLIFFLMMTMLIGINTINCAAESEYTLDDQIGVLKSLNVMKGDPNGNFRLDDYVTRAEFTKMAIAISPVRNAVASQLSVSPFKDVSYTYWAAPYIRLAVTSGYISGYTDSTFRPSNQVTYAEAVTVALKLLGYTDDDFGAAWPYGQMGTASNLGLTDGISGDYNSPLTRGACVILLNNLLDTKIKSGSSKYASSVDCEIKEGVILIATKNEDPTISEGKIYTTGGTYKIPDDFDRNYIGARGDIVVRNGDEIIDFIATDTANLEKIVVYSTLGNAVIGYEGGVLTQVTIPTTTTAYMGTAISTFSGVSPKIDMGTVITMKKDKKGNIEYINVNQGTNLKGPIVVTGGNWYGSYVSDLSNVIIIRDGVKSTVSDIKKNDIAYYSADLNMMFVYVNSKTGIYESASPNKDMPSSITVSGVTYGLEGVDAFNALCSTGSLEYGDTIKVLLGKDGKVAGAVSADSASDTVYGYLVGSGKKTFTNAKGSTYSSYYIELVTPDGDKNEYTTAVSCQNYVNRVVKLTFSDGNA
ncbi:MAG: S-layer homology domain-containing protein, partial [Bacillota bacterium]|nr:S-layer homology domain-containing protein [Bacillota bacterium]